MASSEIDSLAESGDLQITKPSRFGDQFNGHDHLPLKINSKQADSAKYSPRRHDHPHLPIHKRYTSNACSTCIRQSVRGNGLRATDLDRLAWRDECAIDVKDNVGIKDFEKGVEVAMS